jgi:hypothetical protein
MKNLYKSICISVFICFFSQSFAQIAGNYGSKATGNWGTDGTNWLVFVSEADWSDATDAPGAPSTSTNVYIRSGHSVIAAVAGGVNCLNLTVESGGKLYRNSSSAGVVNLYGSIVCNGTIGNGTTTDGISFRLYGGDVSISGSGQFDAYQIYKGYIANAITNLIFAMNVNLRGPSSNNALYNSSATLTDATLFNITINSGVTLAFPNNGGLEIDGGFSFNADRENGGTLTVNGTLKLDAGVGSLYLWTNNTSAPVGLVIGDGGVVNADYINLTSTGTIKPSVSVANNGLLNLTQSGDCPSGQSTIVLQSGSTVKFHNDGSQIIHAWTYHNLIIGGLWAGTKTLAGNTTVNGLLTLMESGQMASGVYTLTYGTDASLEYLGSHTTSDVEWPATFSKNITINSTSTITLNGSKSAYNGTLTFSGGTFDVGAYELSGIGSFLMSGTTKISSSHANGIGNPGNFKLSGTQTFSADGEYEFNSSTSHQYTGNNLPATISILRINNTFSGGNLYLSNNISITGYLGRYYGALNLNGKTLTYQPGSELIISHGGFGAGDMTPGDEFFSTMDIPVSVYNSSGVKFLLNKNLTLNSTLTLSGIIDISSYNLTLGSSATIGGSQSSTAMIFSSSTGELRKTFASNGAFTFPIGDNTATAEYSPCYINLTANAYSSAYVGVKVTNSKHGSNTSVTDYLKRYWTISSSGLTNPSYSAEFTYVTADVNGTEANLYGGKYNGSTWAWLGAVDAVNNKITASGQTGFSAFTAGESAALPVELTSFTANYSGGKVTLNWQTATEVNNYGFEIQRSVVSDQRSVISGQLSEWEKVGFVAGHGNSNSPKDYSIIDNPAASGKYIYRLKQIDNDGKYQYSKEIEIELITPKEFSLSQNYPNPFNPTTLIQYALPNDSRIKLELYSTTGELVAVLSEGEMPAGYHTYEFKSGKYNLSSGVYFYRLSAVENETEKLYTSIKKMIMLK